jgi:hypothetical protein
VPGREAWPGKAFLEQRAVRSQLSGKKEADNSGRMGVENPIGDGRVSPPLGRKYVPLGFVALRGLRLATPLLLLLPDPGDVTSCDHRRYPRASRFSPRLIVVEECSFPRHLLLKKLERYVEKKDEERACDGERVKLRTDEDADSAGKQKRRGGSEVQYLFCL